MMPIYKHISYIINNYIYKRLFRFYHYQYLPQYICRYLTPLSLHTQLTPLHLLLF